MTLMELHRRQARQQRKLRGSRMRRLQGTQTPLRHRQLDQVSYPFLHVLYHGHRKTIDIGGHPEHKLIEALQSNVQESALSASSSCSSLLGM